MVRNRVKRRIRHLVAPLLVPGCAMSVVVRALPKAGQSGNSLSRDLYSAWSACEKDLR